MSMTVGPDPTGYFEDCQSRQEFLKKDTMPSLQKTWLKIEEELLSNFSPASHRCTICHTQVILKKSLVTNGGSAPHRPGAS